jgi:hypothetical protein
MTFGYLLALLIIFMNLSDDFITNGLTITIDQKERRSDQIRRFQIEHSPLWSYIAGLCRVEKKM